MDPGGKGKCFHKIYSKPRGPEVIWMLPAELPKTLGSEIDFDGFPTNYANNWIMFHQKLFKKLLGPEVDVEGFLKSFKTPWVPFSR